MKGAVNALLSVSDPSQTGEKIISKTKTTGWRVFKRPKENLKRETFVNEKKKANHWRRRKGAGACCSEKQQKTKHLISCQNIS